MTRWASARACPDSAHRQGRTDFTGAGRGICSRQVLWWGSICRAGSQDGPNGLTKGHVQRSRLRCRGGLNYLSVGFPYPDQALSTVRVLQTPATVWTAQSVLIDELSRCKPEHQNRLFSLVHERRLQGLPLERLRYRWAAMNPCTSDQGGIEHYSGSEALDPALADRFALIVTAADWNELTAAQQEAIVAPTGEGRVTPLNDALRLALGSWRERFLERVNACPSSVTVHGRPHIAKHSRSDDQEVKIAPVHPDFCCERCSLSLMGSAGRHLDRLRALGVLR